MILDLTELRQDYKSIYRNNWPLAEKIKILIEVTKIEQRFQSHAHQAAKRIAISQILHQSKKSLRTLIRWKQLYRKKGPQLLQLFHFHCNSRKGCRWNQSCGSHPAEYLK